MRQRIAARADLTTGDLVQSAAIVLLAAALVTPVEPGATEWSPRVETTTKPWGWLQADTTGGCWRSCQPSMRPSRRASRCATSPNPRSTSANPRSTDPKRRSRLEIWRQRKPPTARTGRASIKTSILVDWTMQPVLATWQPVASPRCIQAANAPRPIPLPPVGLTPYSPPSRLIRHGRSSTAGSSARRRTRRSRCSAEFHHGLPGDPRVATDDKPRVAGLFLEPQSALT